MAGEQSIQELRDMFPSWDVETLADVLASVDNRLDAAVDLLLQWSCEDATSPGVGETNAPSGGNSAQLRPRLEPVSPWHKARALELSCSAPTSQTEDLLPEVLPRGQYDMILAKRLERKCGCRNLAEVLKVAILWHHRAHVHAAAKKHEGTSCSHLPDASPLAKDVELHRQLSNLSREDSIREGKELLRERCVFLGVYQHEMEDDGNCQFRAISQELFGNQRYHLSVRAAVVQHLRDHADEYKSFFEDAEWQHYVDTMAQPKTWGDELSLRVAAEYFGVRIHVVTSAQENWLLHYEPGAGIASHSREIFLTYVSPIHYNTFEPLR
eukprot:TRINITY_DN49502_c0_g1_i1.p1 TRINITY_DN49502_c0_g1~~TRINITY_DN49502_c0_g1_i1.p1  ORF type:complete len:346 (+),score=54.07 TRINITY_DN49502_c0_g1_i1:66-1040(+)